MMEWAYPNNRQIFSEIRYDKGQHFHTMDTSLSWKIKLVPQVPALWRFQCTVHKNSHVNDAFCIANTVLHVANKI